MPPSEPRAVGLRDELLVDAARTRSSNTSRCALVPAVSSANGVAEAGDVDAHELELGREVGAGEGGRAAAEPLGERVGHLVAGGDQAVDHAAVQGAPRRSRRCRDRCVRSRSSTTTPPRSPTARPASRASSSRGRMPAETTTMSTSSAVAAGERDALDLPSPRSASVLHVEVDVDAERLDRAAEDVAAARRRPAAASGAGRTRRRGCQARGRGPPSRPRGRAGRRRSRPRVAARADHARIASRSSIVR